MDAQADAAVAEHVIVGGGEEGRAALAEARRHTLWQALSASAERLPDKVCLVGARDTGEIGRLTYRQLTAAGASVLGRAREHRREARRPGRAVDDQFARLDRRLLRDDAARRGGGAGQHLPQAGRDQICDRAIGRAPPDHARRASASSTCPRSSPRSVRPSATAREPGILADAELPDLRNVVMLSRGGRRHPGAFDFAELEALGAAERIAMDRAGRPHGSGGPARPTSAWSNTPRAAPAFPRA